MAYVTVPKDLEKVKNKVVFNLTLRQILCVGAGGAVGVPLYFLTKDVLGTTGAATAMVLVMLPAFLFAMYEKDGQPLEKVLWNIILVKYVRPAERKYCKKEDTSVDSFKNIKHGVKGVKQKGVSADGQTKVSVAKNRADHGAGDHSL